MKVILSHDVDHLFLYEHWKDSFVPGLLFRSLKSVFKGASIRSVSRRFSMKQNRTSTSFLHDWKRANAKDVDSLQNILSKDVIWAFSFIVNICLSY